MQPLIVLPTYNEKENLDPIVREIFNVGIQYLKIIVVDDGSPDGTGEIADHLADEFDNLTVIHRQKKEGLGRAYVAGFKKALEDPTITHVFEMDADFSHQPKYLPDFLTMAKDYDLVLGSRNIPGGGVENWNWLRKFISGFANAMVRRILNIPVYDLTGGYKCWSRQVLEALDLDAVESSGYNFQIELTYKTFKKGFKIGETPIIFVERRAGNSKFSSGIMLESLINVIKLRFRKIK